jgi:hypothetical protein
VTLEFTAQLFDLLPHRFVAVLPAPLANPFESSREPFPHRFAPNDPFASPALPPIMGEAQKVEGLCRRVLGPAARGVLWSAKRYQSRFLGV